jgi:polyhydroxybutyrate depolymerase
MSPAVAYFRGLFSKYVGGTNRGDAELPSRPRAGFRIAGRSGSNLRALRRVCSLTAACLASIGGLLGEPKIAQAAAICANPVPTAGWQTVTVISGGLHRPVPLYVPSSATGRSNLPLVFDLHGSEENGPEQARRSGLVAQADLHGFLVANPNGGIAYPDNSTDHFYWHVPGVPLYGGVALPANAPDDVQFFRDAIAQLTQVVCVDAHRVYVTGFSGGARMASVLACELADRIAAVAPVAGLRAGIPRPGDLTAPDPKTCQPTRAVPIVTFHGVHDPTNRFDGDGESRWGYSVPVALANWGRVDGCQAIPVEQRISAHVTRVSYLGCRNTAELILYRIDAPVDHGGGHIWPHPGTFMPDPVAVTEQVDELDASALIWDFFSRHPH